jgi:hypothetical protein
VTGRLAEGEVSPGVFRFTRSRTRILLDGVVAPIGAVAFLVVAVVMAAGGMGIGVVMFGFFGVVMALGSFVTIGSGVQRTVFEVTPDGIWSPASGWLAWHEIAEVRLESMRGIGSGSSLATTRYRRVGIMPRDASLADDLHAQRAATVLVNAYLEFVRRMAPGSRLAPIDMAPFGVTDSEIREPIDAVVAAVRRYAPVVDADERRARERAPIWAARAREGLATSPITDAEIRAIDAGLDPEAPAQGALDAAAAGPGAPRARRAPRRAPAGDAPGATFVQPGGGLSALASAIAPVLVVAVGAVVGVRMLSVDSTGPLSWISIALIGVLAVLVLGRLARIVRRVRRSSGPRETLTVGPDGIWVPGLASPLPWADVAVVRTERARAITFGQGQAEAWRIVIEPAVTTGAGPPAPVQGGRLAVRSDDLDAPFDDVLDLIRYYHPVVETA